MERYRAAICVIADALALEQTVSRLDDAGLRSQDAAVLLCDAPAFFTAGIRRHFELFDMTEWCADQTALPRGLPGWIMTWFLGSPRWLEEELQRGNFILLVRHSSSQTMAVSNAILSGTVLRLEVHDLSDISP